MTDTEDSAPGWDAIDSALKAIYPDQEPLHWGPIIHYRIGGPDPLDGISAYKRLEPIPHWHLVTYGFSDLYAKESEDPAVSGYGFELTLRLRTADFGEPPPNWVLNFLQNLARYVFKSGNAFDVGHHMPLNSPIALGQETELWAVAFTLDPELGEIDSPHGHINFLQVVGITMDELAAIKAWRTERFLELMASVVPLMITDLRRNSVLEAPEVRQAATAGAQEEGSSTAILYVGEARWHLRRNVLRRERLVVTIGANATRDFGPVLTGRVLHGNDLVITAGEQFISFAPADTCSWTTDEEGHLKIRLTRAAAMELASTVAPKRGVYVARSFPELSISVVKSEIKDRNGNIVEVIG